MVKISEKLIIEVENNNIEKVKKLIKKGAKPSYDNSFSVKKAAQVGNIELLKLLIENGGDVFNNENDDDFKNALEYACESGHLDMVNYLIELGVPVNKEERSDNYDFSPIEYALENKFIDIVVRLKEAGENSQEYLSHDTPLILALKLNDIKNFNKLIELGEDINNNRYLGDEFTTLITYCLNNELINYIPFLIEKGAIVRKKDTIDMYNSKNKDKIKFDCYSALEHAVLNKQYDVIPILIDNGAEVDEVEYMLNNNNNENTNESYYRKLNISTFNNFTKEEQEKIRNIININKFNQNIKPASRNS